jgi:hypothetical protein
MAKRRSKQDVGANQDATPFDYSQAEWSNIEEPIRAIGKSLPNHLRELLVENARDYRAGIRMQPQAKERRDCQRILRLCEHLHQAISVIAEEQVEFFNIYGKRKEAKRDRRWVDNLLRGVLEIKLLAKDRITLKRDPPARVLFQDNVLYIWTLLGGQLRFSRSKRGPQGPLIRFFRAVTSPVMGASAPSLQSIPDIVRRRKKFPTLEAYMQAYHLTPDYGDSQ